MLRYFCLLLFLAVSMFGCGGGPTGPEKYTVTGSVTFDGMPVESGTISFESADGKSGAGIIKAGSYTAEVPAGKKTVRINALKQTGKKGPYGEDVSEELIPKEYNAESKETAEVKTTGDNKIDFAIVSKK